MLKKNHALGKLNNGQQIIGTWNIIPSPLVVDVICSTKLDFLIIDSEHGVVSFETAQTAAMVCDSRGVSPIFRVGGVIEDQILRALDIGMHGIQVPNIRSADEMKKLVELAKYPPLGNRGFSPYTRAGEFNKENSSKLTTVANTNTLLIINVEDDFGLRNLDEIAEVEGLISFLGMFDLSKALGVPGDVESYCFKCLKEAVEVIHRYNKGWLNSRIPSMLGLLKNIGVDYITYSLIQVFCVMDILRLVMNGKSYE